MGLFVAQTDGHVRAANSRRTAAVSGGGVHLCDGGQTDQVTRFHFACRHLLWALCVDCLCAVCGVCSLGLNKGHFSHIFFDESGEALEAETLIPLCLADHSTAVILAGDHRQLGPAVHSPFAAKLGMKVLPHSDRHILPFLCSRFPLSCIFWLCVSCRCKSDC